MKIYINKYRYHWLSPYTIMGKVLFWKKWTDPDFDLYDDKNDHYTDWLVKPCQSLQKFLDIVHPKIDYVKIDKWDTWSMDSTLSKIILPMLKQLQATKQGAPFVEDEDVPEELRSTSAPAKENDWDTDDNHFKRWDWALAQMIWSFERLNDENDGEEFHTGVHDTKMVPCEWDENGKVKLLRMEEGPNHTAHFDAEGYTAHQAKIQVGLNLFGKYYRNLWD